MFQINPASRIPLYEQIYNNIIKLASVGAMNPNDKLPAVRALATQLGINPNTVAKAYRQLENDGYIYSTVGRAISESDKLSKESALKSIALDDFKRAVINAHTYGVDYQTLVEIVDSTYKGGKADD